MAEPPSSNCPSKSELNAYSRGSLPESRQCTVEAHIASCSSCRQNVLTSDDIGQLLRSHLFVNETTDPEAHAKIMRRIREISAQPDANLDVRPDTARSRYVARYWRPVVGILGMIVVIAMFTMPRDTWADFPLSRYVGFDMPEPAPGQPQIIPDSQAHRLPTTVPPLPTIEGVELEFVPVSPQTLPGGFQLTEQLITSSDRLEVHYERADEFALHLSEAPAATSRNAIERDLYELVNIAGVDVLISYVEAFNSASHVIWEQSGVIFNLTVPTVSKNWTLPPDGATQVVHAIVTAQRDQ